uniref:Sulfotransferase domain-containing protein n=1 Tax=Strigamia maritima TaxID=126957 RepID=T1II83_STRMM
MADICATLVPSNDKIYKHFQALSEIYLIGKEKFCFPKNGPKVAKQFQDFKVREDDVGVLTFPKSGTTWMEEIAYLLINDLDFDKANSTIRDMVVPYADLDVWEIGLPPKSLMEIAANLPSPRCFKLHMNLSLLPPDFATKAKIIYVCRNVKDVIISYYYFSSAMLFSQFEGSIEEFADLFMENKVPYAPHIAHVREVWERRHEKNIYFTSYEELKENQEKVIAEVAQFLNKTLSKDQIKMVADHCKFDNMKTNPATNKGYLEKSKGVIKDYKFMRKGTVGNSKTEMSPELIEKIDKWIVENTKDCPDLRNYLL